jgi:hypothetical protein
VAAQLAAGVTASPPWEAWAPPLDPPTAGGLPYGQAEAIAGACWADEPHLAAELMWTSYAAQLAPEAAVASVTTGAQSVVYSGAAGGGDFGKAAARAAWHHDQRGAQPVPVELAPLRVPARLRP